jgi:hypothetical protein
MTPSDSTPHRSYSLRPEEHYLFFTGATRDGKYFILGPDNPNLIHLLFDSRGDLLEVRHVGLSASRQLLREAYEQLFRSYYRCLQTQEGYSSEPAHFKPFSLPDDDIAVLDLPFHLRYDLKHPDKLSESERAECREAIEEWTAAGNYVLVWGNEFHVDKDGAIISS